MASRRGCWPGRSWSFVITSCPCVSSSACHAINLSIRTRDTRLVRWSSGEHELVDLTVDPGERRNLVDQRPVQAGDLERRLPAEVSDVWELAPIINPSPPSAATMSV